MSGRLGFNVKRSPNRAVPPSYLVLPVGEVSKTHHSLDAVADVDEDVGETVRGDVKGAGGAGVMSMW